MADEEYLMDEQEENDGGKSCRLYTLTHSGYISPHLGVCMVLSAHTDTR